MFKDAKKLIQNSIHDKALNSPDVTTKTKNVIRSHMTWFNSFKTVGDIYRFLKSNADSDSGKRLSSQLERSHIPSYESLLSEFEAQFKSELMLVTQFADFKVGKSYMSRELLIPIGKYDTRLGGIQLHESEGDIKEIVIKATLNDGKYPNEWLSKGKLLKYYMKSISGVFKESYKDNAAIINSIDIPIHAFVRESASDNLFKYYGIFKYLSHITEDDSGKWFTLESASNNSVLSTHDINNALNQAVSKSKHDSPQVRRKRLLKAPRKPKKRLVMTPVYDRNPDVIAEVLERAGSKCEKCLNEAPFKKRKDGMPYLEVHHIVRLADGGDDIVENAIALCPNCHRESHYG